MIYDTNLALLKWLVSLPIFLFLYSTIGIYSALLADIAYFAFTLSTMAYATRVIVLRFFISKENTKVKLDLFLIFIVLLVSYLYFYSFLISLR